MTEANKFNLDEPKLEFDAPVEATPETLKCEGCGADLDPSWKMCPSCGKSIAPFIIWDFLSTIPDAPTKEEVEELKKAKGIDVRVAILDDNRVYFLRPLPRDIWRGIQMKIKDMKDPLEQQETLQKEVVDYGVVWPKPNSPIFGVRAGTYPTLYEQIMFISDFFDPQAAINMVFKL